MTDHIQSLDFQTIERASEKYENIREVVVSMDIGETIQQFTVEIYKHFSPVSIQMCIRELIEKLDMVRANDKDGMEGMLVPYTIFLAIKHFTTLELPTVFSHQLKAIEHMTNTGVMLQIFAAFDEEELNLFKDEVQYIVDNFNKNMPEIEKIKADIKEQLHDKSLLE